ncbi:MAG: hypothetical protein P1Q69_14130, partial [Candidatus Thorarchaeota archaeon]|nr:hypothetical protein [Candidatus Thorarchaeota archaeon]
LFLMLKIENDCQRYQGQRRWKRHEGPLAIIMLVSITAILAMPLIYGNAHRSFAVAHISDTSTFEYSFSLTGETPEVTLDALEHLPEEYYSAEIRIEVLMFEEPIRIRTQADSQFFAYLSTVDVFSDSHIGISINDESSHTIEIRRIDQDTTVSFNIVLEWVYIGQRSDSTFPILLATVAIAPASIALYQAFRISRKMEVLVSDNI